MKLNKHIAIRSQVQLRMEYTARGEMPALEGAFLADLATIARELRCALAT